MKKQKDEMNVKYVTYLLDGRQVADFRESGINQALIRVD